jgi:2-polyprenyl-3-methyl-5-hydroxy-6-metoxy-1,4-benzoquinol methylase
MQANKPAEGFREDQREFFDRLITDSWAAYKDPLWDRSRRLEIDELFASVAPRRILDVGCGCGFHDVLMAERPGVEVVQGIDYSARSVEAAEREYPHPQVHRRVGDLFSEPRGDYDLVVSFQVIEHLVDQAGFVEACARQARPGGWVAVGTPNRLRLDNRVRLALRREVLMIDPMHYRELSMRDLRRLGASAGLEFVTTFGHGLSLVPPRLNRQVIPPERGVQLARRMPALANVLCSVFRVPA